MTIHIDSKAAFFIMVGLALLAVNMSNTYVATREVYTLVKGLHFNLVQAPFEAAFNTAKAARDAAKE